MAQWRERPEPPEWPGYVSGRSEVQWNADHNRAGAIHDKAVKTKLRQAMIDLMAAMLTEDKVEMVKQMALIKALKAGLLPQRAKGKAPLASPGGSNTNEGISRFWSAN